MPRDILIYGNIHEYSVMFFFDQLMRAAMEEPDSDLMLRVNSNGGDPQYGMSLIAKIQELKNASILVEGGAHSMALFMLCYLDQASAIDTANGVLHRAAYGRWLEEREGFQQSVYYDMLVRCNKDLEKALRAKVDVASLEALPQMKEKNLTLKDIFSLEARNEVLLTAADMKKIGLIQKIVKITPTRTAEIKTLAAAFDGCESLSDYRMAAKATALPPNKHQPDKTMTLEELKAQHPAIYAEAVRAGTDKERDRVEAWMAFVDIDAVAVAKGIEEGKDLSAKAMAEFTRKGMSAEALKKVEGENAPGVETGEDPNAATAAKTADEKEGDAFEERVRAEMKRQKIIA